MLTYNQLQSSVDPSYNTASGSVFGLVPDGQGGYMTDPQNAIDARRVKGFSATQGSWGANIADPSLRAVALSPRQLRTAGVNMGSSNVDESGLLKSHAVRVVAPNGQEYIYGIGDKLGTKGRIDFTYPAYQELGGPSNKGGGIIPNLKYSIVPRTEGTTFGAVSPQATTQPQTIAAAAPATQPAAVPSTSQVFSPIVAQQAPQISAAAPNPVVKPAVAINSPTNQALGVKAGQVGGAEASGGSSNAAGYANILGGLFQGLGQAGASYAEAGKGAQMPSFQPQVFSFNAPQVMAGRGILGTGTLANIGRY